MTSPCVRSGFCCKRAPCGHGEVTSPTNPSCRFLEVEREIQGVPLYRCGIYKEITAKPGWEFSPAFGAGCSSTLFNEDRDRVLHVLRAEEGRPQRPSQ